MSTAEFSAHVRPLPEQERAPARRQCQSQPGAAGTNKTKLAAQRRWRDKLTMQRKLVKA